MDLEDRSLALGIVRWLPGLSQIRVVCSTMKMSSFPPEIEKDIRALKSYRFLPNGLVSTNETIIFKNAFQFSEHVLMFQTSSSAIMNICKDLQKWSVYITTHIQ